MNTNFIIITPTYNAEDWIERNITSLKKQKYKNFKSYIVNDLSTDKTKSISQKCIDGDSRFEIIDNEIKSYPLGSTINGINSAEPAKEDVIVILDGDDWLFDENALLELNNTYQDSNCLMTYGSYVEFPSENRGIFCNQIPSNVIENNLYREYQFMASHLKSFKFKLWQKIKFSDLLDYEDSPYPMAGDIAYAFPLLEMAGERAKFIEKILYVYNSYNPLNEHKTDHDLQLSIEQEIRNKPKYSLEEF